MVKFFTSVGIVGIGSSEIFHSLRKNISSEIYYGRLSSCSYRIFSCEYNSKQYSFADVEFYQYELQLVSQADIILLSADDYFEEWQAIAANFVHFAKHLNKPIIACSFCRSESFQLFCYHNNIPLVEKSPQYGWNEEKTQQILQLLYKIEITRSFDSQNFCLPIEDIYSIEKRGEVFVGKVVSGSLSMGDHIEIIPKGIQQKSIVSSVISMEKFRCPITETHQGDYIGLMVRGLKEHVAPGTIAATPNTIQMFFEFYATLYAPAWQSIKKTPQNKHIMLYISGMTIPGKIWTQGVMQSPDIITYTCNIKLDFCIATCLGNKFMIAIEQHKNYDPVLASGIVEEIIL